MQVQSGICEWFFHNPCYKAAVLLMSDAPYISKGPEPSKA